MTTEELLAGQKVRGIKARHIPYEFIDGEWQKNPEHEEKVTLLEYFHHYMSGVSFEGILYIRPDMTIGKDRVDSFIINEASETSESYYGTDEEVYGATTHERLIVPPMKESKYISKKETRCP